jgi:hydrogenase expression/formation protein HypD
MRFVDEYRDPELITRLVSDIAHLGEERPLTFMEICGGHTHTIYKYGIEDILPRTINMVHGPGCPVCVLPTGRIDDAIAIARTEGVIFTTFGDMMRVPGSQGSLLDARAAGADVRFVYSPLDALKLTRQNPEREVVWRGHHARARSAGYLATLTGRTGTHR